MIKGYKYFLNPVSREWFTVPIDHEVAEFAQTMDYHDIHDITQDEFLKRYCSEKWVSELHRAYERGLSKERLTIGIGSGYGEHELLLHLKGYPILASDIIPDLSNKLSTLFPEFRGLTIDIFTNDIHEIVKKVNNYSGMDFDLLVTGLDFYFDSNTTQVLFNKLAQNLAKGAFLVFTLRYPASTSRRIVEFFLYSEAQFNHWVRRKGIIQKHHGYRKSVKEIIAFADSAGFRVLSIEPVMLGCECSRNRILGLFQGVCILIDGLIPLFNCAYVLKFEKSERT